MIGGRVIHQSNLVETFCEPGHKIQVVVHGTKTPDQEIPRVEIAEVIESEADADADVTRREIEDYYNEIKRWMFSRDAKGKACAAKKFDPANCLKRGADEVFDELDDMPAKHRM